LKKRCFGLRCRREKEREKKRMFKLFLPLILMVNVRSLANKRDKFGALTRTQQQYRESSFMCFTKRWLHEHIMDSNASLYGCYVTEIADREVRIKREGSAAIVNNRVKFCT